jgi:hypothetical protein
MGECRGRSSREPAEATGSDLDRRADSSGGGVQAGGEGGDRKESARTLGAGCGGRSFGSAARSCFGVCASLGGEGGQLRRPAACKVRGG